MSILSNCWKLFPACFRTIGFKNRHLVLLWRWEFYKSKKSKLHQKDANMVAISLMIVMIWGVHLLCFAGCIFSYEGNRREAFCISNRLVNLILRIVTAKIWVQVGFHANLLLHCCQSHCSCWVRSICCLPDVLLLPVKVSVCWDCLCCCSFTVSGTWCTDSKGGRRQDWREGNS